MISPVFRVQVPYHRPSPQSNSAAGRSNAARTCGCIVRLLEGSFIPLAAATVDVTNSSGPTPTSGKPNGSHISGDSFGGRRIGEMPRLASEPRWNYDCEAIGRYLQVAPRFRSPSGWPNKSDTSPASHQSPARRNSEPSVRKTSSGSATRASTKASDVG